MNQPTCYKKIALAVLMFACMFACALVWWFALGGG